MQERYAMEDRSTSATTGISVRGRWFDVPAYETNGQVIVTTGKWIKIASLKDEEWLENELINPNSCTEKMKGRSEFPKADLLCFSQKVPNTAPRYKYQMERTSVAAAHVPTYNEWWKKLPQVTRKNVRRAYKRGVVVKARSFEDDVVEGIQSVQNETPIRQGRAYPHYGKSFDEVKHDHGAFLDRSEFICAYYQDEIIGVLKLVYRGDVASILQINSKEAHYDKRPSNALIAKAAELCDAKGICYLTYGLFNYGNKGDCQLREFKVRNGFEEMLVPTYYVPLSKWGKVFVKARLYRGLLGILPHWAIQLSLKVRKRWYDLRVPRGRCSSMPERSSSDRQTGCSNPPAGSTS